MKRKIRKCSNYKQILSELMLPSESTILTAILMALGFFIIRYRKSFYDFGGPRNDSERTLIKSCAISRRKRAIVFCNIEAQVAGVLHKDERVIDNCARFAIPKRIQFPPLQRLSISCPLLRDREQIIEGYHTE